MSREGKSIKTEKWVSCWPQLEGLGRMEFLLEVMKCSKIDCYDGCTLLKTAELYTLNVLRELSFNKAVFSKCNGKLKITQTIIKWI